ncbi:tyrosine-protein phosphatase [Listeria aquatica]|uniref:Tyrosine-protein phosphatase n=1 Tax=Listeria aquatica TaxID=1494960 RepID=A0A841ZL81_9LIST|nr:tyrosine-protein phosphatase [Listeria aquatica]MBC1520267.1 tyrosine-protein phosphatase [Listeria aquatica]
MKVTRDNNYYVISWENSEAPAGTVLYESFRPEKDETANKLTVIQNGENSFQAAIKSEKRTYFMLEKPNGERKTAAERILAVPGVFNFRDLGGYLNRSQKTVKWGMLYRSGSLAKLTKAGEEKLQELGIHWICDLRSEAEVQAAPTPVIPGIQNKIIPIGAAKNELKGQPKLELPSDHTVYEPLMGDSYKVFIHSTKDYFTIFNALLKPQGTPFLFHCTAGKDRTGILAALLLHLLDVPEETIFKDYEITNEFTEQILEEVGALANSFSAQEEKVALETFRPMAEARPSYLTIAFDEMKRTSGSVDLFLEKEVGITREMKQKLQGLLLE